MKDKTLTNKKVISALMIGISAMMTLQSPVTAYASGDVEPLPDGNGGTPDTTSQTPQEVDKYEPVTDEAQEQAEVAQKAISETTEDVVEGATQEAKEAALLILSGDEQEQIPAADATEEGTKAGDEIDHLIEAAQAVVQDVPQEDGSRVPSAISDFEEASLKIEEVKEDLTLAEQANKDVESSFAEVKEESKEIVDSAKMMLDMAEGMEAAVSVDEKTSELVNSIQDAASKEDAEAAYKNLEKLVDEMKDDLATKKAVYDKMVEDYDNAVKKLEQAQLALDDAEQRFEGKVSDAVQGTILAQASVEEAQRKVDNLADALDKVEDKLSDEAAANELATIRGSKEWSGAFGSVDKNRIVMKEVVVNYYMPKVLGIDVIAEEVNYTTDFVAVKGAEGQEYNYHKFTYKYRDENGDIQTGVKYFNWDSLTKINLSRLNVNGNDGIVIFEKSEDEVAADTLVKTYYAGQKILKDAYKKDAYFRGDFDVFMYTDDNGEKKYLIRDQINNPQDGEQIVFAEDGETPISVDGYELTKVIQNKNNLLHDANCLIIASEKNLVKYTTQKTDVRDLVIRNNGQERLTEETVNKIIEDGRALNSFIVQNSVATNPNTSELMSKYAQYKEATLEAKAAAKNATEEVNKLADAIDSIEKQSKNKKSRMAVDVLGVSDIATALGLKVTDQEAERINGLTMGALVTELNELKQKADEKAAAAQAKATELQAKFDNAAGVLEKTIARLTPPEAVGGSIEDGGDNGAVVTELTGGMVTGSAGVRAFASSGAMQAVANAAIQSGVAFENDASGGTSGVALENNVAGGTNGVALENAGAAGGSSTIEDEMVALSDEVMTVSYDEDSRPTIEASQSVVKASEEKVVTIEEENTALSATAESGTIPEKKSWWWILIIAVLGTTGEMMYKRHLKKKEEKLKNEDDEWD